MEKIKINQKIVDALGLSENERAVFDALLKHQMSTNVSRIASRAQLPRMTVFDILKRLEKRSLVVKSKLGSKTLWRYKKGLEFFERGLEENIPEDGILDEIVEGE